MPTESSKQPCESRLREAGSHIEQDVQRLLKFINDDVLPDVRRNGSRALKAAAIEFEKLAESMDAANRAPGTTATPPPPPPPPHPKQEP